MCTDSFYTIPQSTFENNLEKILDIIDSGFGPIRIIGDNGKSYLLLSWNDYVREFGYLYSSDELSAIESACREETYDCSKCHPM